MPKTPLTDLFAYAGAFLTVGQLADYWGVSRKHILKLIEAGCLEAIRLGPKTYRVRVHTVIEFERQNGSRESDGVVDCGARIQGQNERARLDPHDRRSHAPRAVGGPMEGITAQNG